MRNLLYSLAVGAMLSAAAQAQEANTVTVQRADSVPPREGPAENFTGKVEVRGGFQRSAPARVGGATVTFQPGARTNWHTHPLGQTLVVTAGQGWVQHWGGERQAIRPGDVVWIPPNVKHWHGASAEQSMTHLAVSEKDDAGVVVEWLEVVTDAQYEP